MKQWLYLFRYPQKYNQKIPLCKLSGRNLDDVINASRELGGVEDKRNQTDFALWKKATPEHIMKWPSPWSEGFPRLALRMYSHGTQVFR